MSDSEKASPPASAAPRPVERRQQERTLRQRQMDDLMAGRVCIVTGGAQGVGWAITQALADHGALVFTCDISEERIAALRKELPTLPFGAAIRVTHCDVSDRAAVERWISNIIERQGRIDVLVNNAAFVKWESIDKMSVEDDLRTMRVGYEGMVYTTHAVLPQMIKAGRGNIVNIGSSSGKVFAGGHSAAYAAVKAAIDGYSQSLQTELRRTHVRVTLIRPSVIAGTDFFKKNVPFTRIPKVGDYVPYLTPPKVADAILEAIVRGRQVVDIPGILPFVYGFYALAPNLFRWLMERSGSGTRDYGAVDWRYTPRRALPADRGPGDKPR